MPLRGLLTIGLAVTAAALGILVIDRGRTVLVLVTVSLAVAIVVAPVVARLADHVPRPVAVVGSVLVGLALSAAASATLAWDLDRQADDLSGAITEAVESLPADGTAARIAADADLSTRAGNLLDGVAAELLVGDDDPLAVAGLASRFVLVAVLAAFMVTQGPALLASLVDATSRPRVRRAIRSGLRAAADDGSSFVRRTILVSAAHGLLAGFVAGSLDLPGAITIGAWAALAVTLPILGGPLAWAPIVAVAAATQGQPVLVIAIGLVAIVADRALRARWIHPVLRPGPVLVLVGIGIVAEVLGVVGGFVGLVAVAVLVAATRPEVADVGDTVEQLVDDPAPGTDPVPRFAVVDEVEDGPVLRLRPSRRTATAAVVLVVGAVATLRLLGEANGLLVWVVLGSFVAVGLDRPVAALGRRPGIPRPAAIAVVVGGVAVAVAAVGWFAGPSLTDSASEVAAEAPDAVAALESLPLVGPILAENDLSSRLEEEIALLPDRIRESDVAERLVAAAGDGLIGAFWTISTILAVLLDGPRLVEEARRRVAPDARERAVRLGRASYRSLSNIAAASAFVAALSGTVVMLIAVALGVPLAPVLGIWAAWWNLIPQVGGLVGAAPLVLLAIGQGPWHGVVALVLFVAYQTFENHVLQPAIGGRAVKVPPLLMLVGVLLGGSLFGFVGAILSGPALGVAKVALDDWRGPGEDGATAVSRQAR